MRGSSIYVLSFRLSTSIIIMRRQDGIHFNNRIFIFDYQLQCLFRYCVSPETLKTSESMSEFWTIISTNHDDNGTEFVSLFESKKYPIWGSQFHPEKNQVSNKVVQKPHFSLFFLVHVNFACL